MLQLFAQSIVGKGGSTKSVEERCVYVQDCFLCEYESWRLYCATEKLAGIDDDMQLSLRFSS